MLPGKITGKIKSPGLKKEASKKKEKSQKSIGTVLDIRVVILAGGSGTRFWPLSRQKTPKQYLKILSDRSLIEETVERVQGLVPNSRIYTIAKKEQNKLIKKLLPAIPKENLLVEPEARNTTASLLLATACLYLQNPESVVVVLPSDHYIREVEKFRQKLIRAAEAAFKYKKIVLFGIPPTSPSTGYGYIHCPEYKSEGKVVGEEKFYQVASFKEKPDLPTALDFLQSGDYFWNSGIFLWRADVFEDSLRKFAPELFSVWMKMLPVLKNKNQRELVRLFRQVPSLSIDYALIEKIKMPLMARGDFGWSDLGSWSALYDFFPQDENCIAARGKTIALGAHKCLVFAPEKTTALIGVENLIVVDAGDALLICHRDHDQKVKELVEKIKQENSEAL
ncbi:MAG: mannose-1-phosphate guanylyltransferase [Candidatus Saccharicenans sp.]